MTNHEKRMIVLLLYSLKCQFINISNDIYRQLCNWEKVFFYFNINVIFILLVKVKIKFKISAVVFDNNLFLFPYKP